MTPSVASDQSSPAASPAAEPKPIVVPPAPQAQVDQASPSAKESRKVIDFKSGSAYSIAGGAGYGCRDFNNGQGMDHCGGLFRLSFGLNFRPSEHFKLTPRGFFEHQQLDKSLGEGISSEAKVDTFGVEVLAGFPLIRDWFSVGASFGFGAAMYSSPDTTDGLMGGSEFNENAQKYPIDETGIRLQPGLFLGTFNDALTLNATYALDSGVNPLMASVDGNGTRMGLNPYGFSLFAMADVGAIVGFFEKKKSPAAEATPALASMQASRATPAASSATPGTTAAPSALPNGLALVEQGAKQVKEAMEQAKSYADRALDKTKEFKKEKDGAKRRSLATDGILIFRGALPWNEAADKYVSDMKAQVEKLQGGDRTKAAGLLKEADKNANTANALARVVWDRADSMVKQYNKGKPSEQQMDFPDSKPHERGRPMPELPDAPPPAPRPAAAKPAAKGEGDKAKKEEGKKEEKKEEKKKEEGEKPIFDQLGM
jgi:hypothetical protein